MKFVAAPRWMLLVITLAARPGLACETERADIRFEGRAYSYDFDAVMAGRAAAVRDIITAHTRLARINDNIVESRVLRRDGEHKLKRLLRLERCVLGFCFDLRFTEMVEEAPALITTTIVPAESSFLDGVTTWATENVGTDQVRLTLRARQTPDFWIPPVIGPLILKRVFVAEVEETCARIEALMAPQQAAHATTD